MQTLTTSWVSGGLTRTISCAQNPSESDAGWMERHEALIAVGLVMWPQDPEPVLGEVVASWGPVATPVEPESEPPVEPVPAPTPDEEPAAAPPVDPVPSENG